MTEDNLMSDAVMVPRVPTGAMISAGERAAWDEDNSMPAISAMRKAWEAMLAASTPVGGWEDISTAPKDGTNVLLWSDIFAGEISGPVPCVGPLIGRYRNGVSDYAGEGWWDVEGGDACASWCLPTHWMPLPPPPSVSIGSRPQEAVPPELSDADGVVLCEGDTVEFIRDTNGHFRGDRATVTYTFPVPMIGGWTAPHPSCFRHVRQPADGCSSNEGAG